MGLFDTVIGKFFCPFCGAKVDDFQTKDLDPFLDVYTLLRPVESGMPSIEMYTKCDKCKSWVSLNVAQQQLKLKKRPKISAKKMLGHFSRLKKLAEKSAKNRSMKK